MNENEPMNQPKRTTLHPPDGDPKAKKITLWIVVGVIAIAIVYLLLYSNLFKTEEKPQSQVVIPEFTQPHPDTLSQGVVDSTAMEPETTSTHVEPQPIKVHEKKPTEKKKENVSSQKQTGSFTIYVGSFKNKALAQKEKARLIEKDFDAFVLANAGMFRVAVGRFATRDEAKSTAEEIRTRLKKECWVDRLK